MYFSFLYRKFAFRHLTLTDCHAGGETINSALLRHRPYPVKSVLKYMFCGRWTVKAVKECFCLGFNSSLHGQRSQEGHRHGALHLHVGRPFGHTSLVGEPNDFVVGLAAIALWVLCVSELVKEFHVSFTVGFCAHHRSSINRLRGQCPGFKGSQKANG